MRLLAKPPALVWILSTLSAINESVSAFEVGDTICVEGYIMDHYCIANENMIDTGKRTLKEPFAHTVHCLVDVPVCYNSAFEVLTDPSSEGSVYTRGFRLTDDSKESMLSVARSVRSCGTCVNGYTSSMLATGFRAVMTATVLDLEPNPAEDAPPLIAIDQVKPSNNLGVDPCQKEFGMRQVGVSETPFPTASAEPSSTPTMSIMPSLTLSPTTSTPSVQPTLVSDSVTTTNSPSKTNTTPGGETSDASTAIVWIQCCIVACLSLFPLVCQEIL